MHGDRRAHVVQAIGKQQLHPLRDSPVDEAPARRSDSAVSDLADAVVAEIPPLVRLNADDVAPPELVERADERVFLEVAGLGENVEPEIAPHRCRDFGGRARVVREQRQSRGDNRLHLRQRVVAGGARLPRQLHASALDNEQGMTFGFAERARQRRLVQRMLGHFAGQLRRGGPVERAERDRRQQIVALEMTEQPSERRIVLLLLRAHRADNEAARVGCRAHKILEPFDRVAIGPLQVVDDEDEGSRRSECLRQRLEEAQALPALELPIGRRNIGARGEQLGTKSRDVGRPGRIQPHQRRPQRVGLQPRGDRRVGQAPFAGVASRGHRR